MEEHSMKMLNRSVKVEEAHMSTYNNTTTTTTTITTTTTTTSTNITTTSTPAATVVVTPSVSEPSPTPPPQASRKIDLRKQLASQLSGGSSKHCNVLKKQSYVSRPVKGGGHKSQAGGQKSQAGGQKSQGGGQKSQGGGQSQGGGNVNGYQQQSNNHHNSNSNYCGDAACMLPVFDYLTPAELANCALVCRAWSAMSMDPSLWRKLDVTGKRLTASCLAGVVKRQPEVLLMDWTAIAKRQLEWMIAKLTRLKVLSLQGCSWSGVTALRSSTVVPPLLTALDLSYVTGMTDASLRDVLSPPSDSRSSSNDNTNRVRFRNLRTLKLAGVDIGDVSLRYVMQYAPSLVELDLSQNYRITDAGIAQLTTPVGNAVSTLQVLDLSGCMAITDTSLDHLLKCTALRRLDLKQTPKITLVAINKFLVANERFSATETRLLIKSPTPPSPVMSTGRRDSTGSSS